MARRKQTASARKKAGTTVHSNRVFIWLFFGLLFAGVLVVQIWTNMQQIRSANSTYALVQAENEQAKVQKVTLQTQVDLLNDDQYVLKLARAKGFYSLPNELVFTIPEDNPLLRNENNRPTDNNQNNNQ